MRILLGLMTGVAIALGACPPAHADTGGKRVALIIGNAAYQHVTKLENPRNDARLIAQTVAKSGFVLVGGGPQIDLDRAGLERAIRGFRSQLEGGAIGFFFYSGHGMQVGGNNYLIPVDANPETQADIEFELVDAGSVLRQMEAAGSKLNFMILDACRTNPFGGRGMRDAASGGLATMRAPRGTLISYATQPGNTAADGVDGNSPYTKALAEAMQRPGLEVLQMFNQVALAVDKRTNGVQQPWTSISPIDGEFYFAGTPGTPPPPVAQAVAAPAPKPTSGADAVPKPSPVQMAAPPPSPKPPAISGSNAFSWASQQAATAAAAASPPPAPSPSPKPASPQPAAPPPAQQSSLTAPNAKGPMALALAWNDKGSWMVRSGDTLQIATTRALAACNDKWGDCEIVKETLVRAEDRLCLAVAWDKDDHSTINAVSRPALEAARKEVLDDCGKEAAGTCVLTYSYCNYGN